MQELELHLANKPRQRPAGDGLVWVRAAWGLFKQRRVMWMLMASVFLMLGFVSDYLTGLLFPPAVRFLSGILSMLVYTLLMGGWVIAAASLAEEDDLAFSYLFAGFQYKFQPLLVLGLLLGGISVVSELLFGLLLNSWLLKLALAGKIVQLQIVSLLPNVPVWIGGMFAAGLVVLHDISPFRAIVMSIQACLRNWLPSLVHFFLWAFICAVMTAMMLSWLRIFGRMGAKPLAFIPVLLLLLPLAANMLLSTYTSYRNIWTNLPMKK